MARSLRLEAEGAVYRVIARGNELKAVFRGDWDRLRISLKPSRIRLAS
jgi:hypothetical protein